MDDLIAFFGGLPVALRLIAFGGFAVVTHLLVILIRNLVGLLVTDQRTRRYQKLRSIATLATSAVIFSLYFFSVGLILQEFNVPLKGYLASASVIGIAIGFGSQGIVQDVVTGLTFIFSDLIDVGDLVEVSGQTGVVKAITMRFVEIENALGAAVFVPNRTIANIVSYPRGYVRCIADVTLYGDDQRRQAMEDAAVTLMHSIHEQFPGVVIKEPSVEGRKKLVTGKEFLRIKFRIWPNRGQPIETTYLQELTAELQRIDPAYQSWMIAISYEVEAKMENSKRFWAWRARA